MSHGFLTIAAGDEKYYKMAANLLQSYRYFSKSPLPFAILADRENEYTAVSYTHLTLPTIGFV